jgi:WhiB family redox-sensing transcriptional regulator
MTVDSGLAWMLLAECRHEDADLFFPIAEDDIAPAVAICERCFVRAECLAYAVSHLELTGVWGGTAARVRRRMHRTESGTYVVLQAVKG